MKPLLNRLRLRLVLLYLGVGVVLALAIGGGTFGLVTYYLQQTNDEALKQKMGMQFAALGLPVPNDLYASLVRGGLISSGENPSSIYLENPDYYTKTVTSEEFPGESVEINELADIVVVPLTIEGTRVQGAVVTNAWLPIDEEAVSNAIFNGYDFRTLKLENGTPVRVLTYRIPATDGLGILQVARSLSAQKQMLDNLLNGMIVVGSVSILLLGLGAWLSASRSIKPMQIAWEKQQSFVANASHELRTPLTLIHAGVEVAQRNAADPGQKQVLDDVLSDADYMTHLIESLLLLSRLDAHRLPLEIQLISLPELLEEIVRHSSRVLTEREISLTYECEPLTVQADPIRLKQVLLILIDNAARNNHPGGWIKISAKALNNKVIISVADNGTGIAREHLAKLFDRFYKVNDHSSPDYRGSGLGLSIAQGLVEAHNGTIKVLSEPGSGTEVTIVIPGTKPGAIDLKAEKKE
jgi:signal transduction histidine kinase